MKKAGLTAIQVVVYILIYEISAFLISMASSFLDTYILCLPIFQNRLYSISDGVKYTFMPIVVALIVITVMTWICKKNKLTLAAFIIIACYMGYVVISHIVYIISYYGLISWNTINQIWHDVILCGSIFYFLYRLTGGFKKDED